MNNLITLNRDVLREHLRGYLTEVRRTYFAGAPDVVAEHVSDGVVRRVSGWWEQFVFNPTDVEAVHGTDELAANRALLIDLTVHAFHDAANVFRREHLDVDPDVVPESPRELLWPTERQRWWCGEAVDAGLVSCITAGCC